MSVDPNLILLEYRVQNSQLLKRNRELEDKNKKFCKGFDKIKESLLTANKEYVNNQDFLVNYNILLALEVIETLSEQEVDSCHKKKEK